MNLKARYQAMLRHESGEDCFVPDEETPRHNITRGRGGIREGECESWYDTKDEIETQEESV